MESAESTIFSGLSSSFIFILDVTKISWPEPYLNLQWNRITKGKVTGDAAACAFSQEKVQHRAGWRERGSGADAGFQIYARPRLE